MDGDNSPVSKPVREITADSFDDTLPIRKTFCGLNMCHIGDFTFLPSPDL